jgi:hypothetical protein
LAAQAVASQEPPLESTFASASLMIDLSVEAQRPQLRLQPRHL